ncbi:MAG: hypothetical protein E7663_04770 [Ruminococcaceae bacterium]|nr:hypothetical protein [Oscillospiraceae bacterium]
MQSNCTPFAMTFAAAQMLSQSFADSSGLLPHLAPEYYRAFYERGVRRWLAWYDGYVSEVHGSGTAGIVSTQIGRILVDRANDAVFGGGIMFQNENAPCLVDEKGVSRSLTAISDRWAPRARFAAHVKQACKYAMAGGTGLLKLNRDTRGELWIDAYRADRFFPVLDMAGNVEEVKTVLTVFGGERDASFALCEERYYKDTVLTRRIPVRCFSVYRLSRGVGNALSSRVDWKAIPRNFKQYLAKNYGHIRIDEEQALPFATLGCYAFRYTDGCEWYGDIGLGESMLAPIMQCLLSYDYYWSAFNTDMYLGRGRVILKKQFKPRNDAEGGNYNAGLDSFVYEQVPSYTPEEQKPVPIQFELRAADWREIRNNLMESMAFALGLSVGTLASFLSDASNRTAREISAEESATARFVEARRKQFEGPANDCLRDVCLYYGFTDLVTVRWSLAGQTNIDAVSTRVMQEYREGIRSLKSAVCAINPDLDEHQVLEEIERIERDGHKRAASLYGDIGGASEVF